MVAVDLMGDSGANGALCGRMMSVKAEGKADDIPKAVYDHVSKHYPDLLESPDDWNDGQPLGTREAYARGVPSEI